jgi:hypothetical protein
VDIADQGELAHASTTMSPAHEAIALVSAPDGRAGPGWTHRSGPIDAAAGYTGGSGSYWM